MSPIPPHVLLLERAARALEKVDLKQRLAFVGGACVPLHLDDPADESIRLTRDVDCVVSVTSKIEFAELEESLRESGFYQDASRGGPICRWYIQDDHNEPLMLDIMPQDGSVLGFSNDWYEPGLRHLQSVVLPSGKQIDIFSSAYFLATKIEAFLDRGTSDPYDNPDLEDIVTLIDGRESFIDEVTESSDTLREFVAVFARTALENPDIGDALPAHLPPMESSERHIRAKQLVWRFRTLANLKST